MTISPSNDSNGHSLNHKSAHWSSVAAQKVATRDALIPKEWLIAQTDALNVMNVPKTCGVLSPVELQITETTAPELVSQMTTGTLKSYDVVLAFCKRAAVAQQLVSVSFYLLSDVRALIRTDRQTVLLRFFSPKPWTRQG